MNIVFKNGTKQEFLKLFDISQEKCAVLIGHINESIVIEHIHHAPNKHRDKLNHFYIGRSGYMDASKHGCIIGQTHQHLCAPHPSEMDLKTCRSNHVGIIFYPRGGVLTIYNKQGTLVTENIKTPLWMKILSKIFHD